MNVVLNAWFGRVLLETGIAATLIRKTTEPSGNKPAITCILLCIVTTAIFSSLFGAGAVVAISVITFPIFISLGIPKVLSAVSFVLSTGTGMLLNPVLLRQCTAFFLDGDGKVLYPYEQYMKRGSIASAVQLVSIITLTLFCMGKKSAHSWAVRRSVRRKMGFAPTPPLLTPPIPVFSPIVLRVPIIMGLLIGGFYALFIYGKLESFRTTCRTSNKDFFDDVVDTTPLVGFLLVVPMLSKVAELCTPYFDVSLGNIIPRNTLFITVTFRMLVPLGMSRDSSTLYDCDAATLGILKGVGFEAAFLAPLMIAAITVMNMSCCITQSWIVWGISYAEISTEEFLKMSVVCGWIICCILQVITFIMFG